MNDLPRRLAAAHHSRSADLSAARRWTYGTVTGPVARLVGGTTDAEYQAGALTAQAFATWNSGRATPHPGAKGSSLGTAMRQIGTAGDYGPRNVTACRLLDSLLAAPNGPALQRCLVAIINALRSANHPPHWGTLYTDLIDWHDPKKQAAVRLRWGQSFTTARPTQPAAATD